MGLEKTSVSLYFATFLVMEPISMPKSILCLQINDWKFEMDRMLGVFEGQAIESLRYINQSFELSGRPFNEEFRKYFLQISNDRYFIFSAWICFIEFVGHNFSTFFQIVNSLFNGWNGKVG